MTPITYKFLKKVNVHLKQNINYNNALPFFLRRVPPTPAVYLHIIYMRINVI